MPDNGIKIETNKTGVIKNVTFNLKLLAKTKPALAQLIEDIADGERALKNKSGETMTIEELKTYLENKHELKL
jgi:hypothetical protein